MNAGEGVCAGDTTEGRRTPLLDTVTNIISTDDTPLGFTFYGYHYCIMVVQHVRVRPLNISLQGRDGDILE